MLAEQYNPYLYQPMMQYFYGTPHETAVNQFAAWLKMAAPSAYQAVISKNPGLFASGRVVRSGMMGLRGLGSLAQTVSDEAGTGSNVLTDWGNQLTQLVQGYMTYDQQKQLLKVNIARAEKGLPPITGSELASGINIGVSPAVQTMGYVAIGGLMLAGLAMAFKRSR